MKQLPNTCNLERGSARDFKLVKDENDAPGVQIGEGYKMMHQEAGTPVPAWRQFRSSHSSFAWCLNGFEPEHGDASLQSGDRG